MLFGLCYLTCIFRVGSLALGQSHDCSVFSSWSILLMLPLFAVRQYVFVDLNCTEKSAVSFIFNLDIITPLIVIFLCEWRTGWPLNMYVIHIIAPHFPPFMLAKIHISTEEFWFLLLYIHLSIALKLIVTISTSDRCSLTLANQHHQNYFLLPSYIPFI